MKKTLIGFAIAAASVLSFGASANSSNSVTLTCFSDVYQTENHMTYGGTVVLAKGDKFIFEKGTRLEGNDAWLYVNERQTKILGLVRVGPGTFVYQFGDGSQITDKGVCERRQ